MDKQKFTLAHVIARQNAVKAVARAPDGHVVTIAPPTRNLDQNAHFHALCSNLERAGAVWAGKARNAAEWKVLLVSGHAVATGELGEVVPGLESEFVSLRESTATMSRRRSASLIDYSIAFCVAQGIRLPEKDVA